MPATNRFVRVETKGRLLTIVASYSEEQWRWVADIREGAGDNMERWSEWQHTTDRAYRPSFTTPQECLLLSGEAVIASIGVDTTR